MADDYNNGWNGQPSQPRDDERNEGQDEQDTLNASHPDDQDANGVSGVSGVNGNDDDTTPGTAGEAEATERIERPVASQSSEWDRTTYPAQGTDDGSQQQSQQPQSQPQPQQNGYYRPAPQYGAYAPTAPVPNQGQDGVNGSMQNPTQRIPMGFQQNPESGDRSQTPMSNAGNRNPYVMPTGNPFTNNPDPRSSAQEQPAQQRPWGPGGPQGPQDPTMMGQMPEGSDGGRPVQRRTAGNVIVAVVAALVSAALCLGVGYAAVTQGWVTVPTSGSLSSVSSNTSGSGTASAKTGSAIDWTAVAKDVSSSVVSIQTTLSNGTAKGSGAIIDTKGYIVTNNHVISDATSIEVTLANGQMYTAKVVGTDSTTDLAVIKLENPPSDLKAVEFADSDNLAVGEAVMAIGNPLGYDDTATTGIVSALNRPVSVEDDHNSQIVTNAVQIDAAINPGNSGGPTFNAAGQVIGINSSIASTATSSSEAGSIGIGFAIPANLVKRVANEIIKDGSVKHVMLGVTITSDTVTADGVTRGGAKITSSSGSTGVVSGSPAAKAGLKVGDTIVAFNGEAVGNSYSLLGFVRAASLGDKVTLTVVRDSKTITVDVTLDQQEATSSSSSSSGNSNNNENNNENNNNDDGSSGDDGGLVDPFGLW